MNAEDILRCSMGCENYVNDKGQDQVNIVE